MSDSEEDLGIQLKGLKIARHLKESGEHTDEESNSSPEHDCGLSNQDDLTVMHTQAKEEVFKRREEDGTRTEDALHEGEAGKEGTGFPSSQSVCSPNEADSGIDRADKPSLLDPFKSVHDTDPVPGTKSRSNSDSDSDSDDGGWQEMPAVSSFNIYNHRGELELTSKVRNSEQASETSPTVPPGKNCKSVNDSRFDYTKMAAEQQAQRSYRTNKKTDFLFDHKVLKKKINSSQTSVNLTSSPSTTSLNNEKNNDDDDDDSYDEYEDDVEPVNDLNRDSQLNITKNLLSDMEKFAYVGAINILANQMCTNLATLCLCIDVKSHKKLAHRLQFTRIMSDTEKDKDVPMVDSHEATEEPPTTSTNTPSFPHLAQEQAKEESATLGAEVAHKKINYEQEAQKLEEKALRFLAKQTHPVIIPSFASWFDISKIHEIEKRSNPDFFNDSSRFKTPKAYKDTRNFIINTYRLSPYEYLTITAVRRNVAMDVASIVKIHAFLEKWGLINYQIDPRTKPSLIGPSFTGHFQVVLDTPQGLKPFLPENVIKQEVEGGDGAEPQVKKEFPVNLTIKKNVYDSAQDFNALQDESRNSRQIHKVYICHTCGNESINVRYHNLRARDTNLCSRCFQEGHFGANFQSSDFIRLENNGNSVKKNWSDQEMLLLLEGIEMYEDQWEKIADHVGGHKRVEDCIEKFLSLPIEDNYIQEVVGSTLNGKGGDSRDGSVSGSKLMECVNDAVQTLLQGDDKLGKVSDKSREISEKYIEESQAIIQELVKLTMEKLESKFTKLCDLETQLEMEKLKYVKESEKMLNDRLSLSKQILDLNKSLEELNVSKKLVLISEQVDSGIQLVEKDQEGDDEDGNTATGHGVKRVGKEGEEVGEGDSIAKLQPQVYKPWSL